MLGGVAFHEAVTRSSVESGLVVQWAGWTDSALRLEERAGSNRGCVTAWLDETPQKGFIWRAHQLKSQVKLQRVEFGNA